MKPADQKLFDAISESSLKGVEAALAEGADVNSRESLNNRSPLHVAASKGLDAIVDRLVDQPGVNVMAYDRDGRTAADIANGHGFHYIVSSLDKAAAKGHAEDAKDRKIGKREPKAAHVGPPRSHSRKSKVTTVDLDAPEFMNKIVVTNEAETEVLAVADSLEEVREIVSRPDFQSRLAQKFGEGAEFMILNGRRTSIEDRHADVIPKPKATHAEDAADRKSQRGPRQPGD